MRWNGGNIPVTEIKQQITSVGVEFAKKFGTYLAKQDENTIALTTSQLRKFFGAVKQIQYDYNQTDVVLLKPKLAYAVGRAKADKQSRNKDVKIEDFYYVISNAIDQVTNEAEFTNFVKLFEAIVAYHKAAGGKEK